METQLESLSIGELSRRSGLPVKTIRYYSDVGVLPPAARTPAGYRRYDSADRARLDLVRTLRELGVDLGTIRRVLDRQASLADVLALHADSDRPAADEGSHATTATPPSRLRRR